MDSSKMNDKQLAAYNAWLQDPAISSAIATTFSSQSQGSLNSYYGAQMSGGH